LSTGQLLIQWTASQWIILVVQKQRQGSQLQHKDNKMIGHKSFEDRNKEIELSEK
jgi:hypothetical protein